MSTRLNLGEDDVKKWGRAFFWKCETGIWDVGGGAGASDIKGKTRSSGSGQRGASEVEWEFRSWMRAGLKLGADGVEKLGADGVEAG